MTAFSAAEPTGCRACGIEEPPHLFEVLKACLGEIQSLVSGTLDEAIPPAHISSMKADLHSLMDAARNGRVTFGGGSPQATVIAQAPWMYELRQRPPRGRLTKRILRLYCAEPRARENLILGLHLAPKPHGAPDSLGEQDEAIREARRRGEAWEFTRAVADMKGRELGYDQH